MAFLRLRLVEMERRERPEINSVHDGRVDLGHPQDALGTAIGISHVREQGEVLAYQSGVNAGNPLAVQRDDILPLWFVLYALDGVNEDRRDIYLICLICHPISPLLRSPAVHGQAALLGIWRCTHPFSAARL